jgi:hypothetical protein
VRRLLCSGLDSTGSGFYPAVVRAFFTLSAFALAVLAACTTHAPGGSTASGTGGEGGEGGACPMGPQAMFDLTITAADGAVPRSMTLDVSWSAGDEPTFSLDEPSTWKTIDDQANIVCDVDPMKPLPDPLPALVCHLWTAGPTKIVVKANGYTPFEMTYVPTHSDHCHALVPTAVSVELAPAPNGDGGAG